jgi:hypothetical protein
MHGLNTLSPGWQDLLSAMRYWLSVIGVGCLVSCVSEAPAPSWSDEPMASFAGHWEVDYARSDSIQTQLNASFREVQRELRRQREAAERGSTYQGSRIGDLDKLVALAKMAELVTDADLLQIEQDAGHVRIDRENNFALTCDLDGSQSVPSQLGAEQCWWDGGQLHFSVFMPDGLSIHHRFTLSADVLSLAQRTHLMTPGVSQGLEVVRIFSRFDPSNRGYRCSETLSKGRVCTTERVVE